jgi:hypothetical protein
MRVTLYEVVEVASFDSPAEVTEPRRLVLPPTSTRPLACQIGTHLEAIDGHLKRIADALAPTAETVNTRYVASRLGFKSTQRVTQLIDEGLIPTECILPGTGRGGRWRFHRDRIDRWVEDYRREHPR